MNRYLQLGAAGGSEIGLGLRIASRSSASFRKKALIGLFACGILCSAPAGDAAEGGGPIPGNPVRPITMLVHGSVQSPTFDQLSQAASNLQDGTVGASSSYDVLVYDGKATRNKSDEQALRKSIQSALNNDHWVLAFDIGEKRKAEHFGKLINLKTGGSDSSFLVRRVMEPNGKHSWRIISSDASTRPDPVLLANSIRGYIADPSAANAPRFSQMGVSDAPPPDNPVPAGLINTSWYITLDNGPQAGFPAAKKWQGSSQSYYLVVNYTVTAFLNNQNNASGDFQYVLIQTDASLNPSNGGSFASRHQDEQAWFPAHVNFTLQPQNESSFVWVDNAPQTPNQETSYSAGSSFTIGFSGDDGTGSYQYSSSQSYTIPDWAVSSNSSGNNMSWTFRSANPDANKSLEDCSSSNTWFDVCRQTRSTGYPNNPNPLSLTQSVYHTSVVYKTQSNGNPDVLADLELFNAGGSVDWWDNYCVKDTGVVCDEFTNPAQVRYETPFSKPLWVNMAAVLPDPISSVALNAQPAAVAGKPVTGQVILQNPAPIDTTILLSSNSQYASVPPQVKVAQGETNSSLFGVLTSGNGGTDGTLVEPTPVITAFNTTSTQTQLPLKNYSSSDFLPPASYPSWDFKGQPPTNLPPMVPIGSWVAGYQVRYAVAFQDANGNTTDTGAWTPFFTGGPFAMPVLSGIPTDSSGRAVKRLIYRQFLADYMQGGAGYNIANVITLNDNTTTTVQDTNP